MGGGVHWCIYGNFCMLSFLLLYSNITLDSYNFLSSLTVLMPAAARCALYD